MSPDAPPTSALAAPFRRHLDHLAVEHGDHIDYIHGGHRHAVHGGHYDEH